MRFFLTVFTAIFFTITHLNAMTFSVAPEVNTIYAEGEIVAGDADQLLTLIGLTGADTLLIDSPGGSVTAAISVAEIVKLNDMRVHVPNMCASACAAIIFTAGRTSTMSNSATLGFHQCYIQGESGFRSDDLCNEVMRKYAVQNGFPYGTLAILAANVGPKEMYWITRTLATCYGWHSSWTGEKPLLNDEAQSCVQAVIRTQTQDLPYGPSFDCRKASTRVETLICADADLMKVDSVMGNLYWTLIERLSDPEKLELRRQQREWISARNAKCETKIEDIGEYYGTREAVHCMSTIIQDRMNYLINIYDMR